MYADEPILQWANRQLAEGGVCDRSFLELVFLQSVVIVNWIVNDLCYQTLVPGLKDGPGRSMLEPARSEVIWSFKNLLGAMYLQIFWLMGAGSKLGRCEQCGGMISLTRSHPRGRKPRNDKRFCDDACRQANHRKKQKS